jgi:hypothetical protein
MLFFGVLKYLPDITEFHEVARAPALCGIHVEEARSIPHTGRLLQVVALSPLKLFSLRPNATLL